MKRNISSFVLVIVITLVLVVIILFTGSPAKDVNVEVLNIYDQNNQYFVNVSIKNNQDMSSWISDMYLSTVKGSEIDLAGAGEGYKIEPGKTINLTLWSAEVQVSIDDAPFTLTYTAFPSGKEYTVYV